MLPSLVGHPAALRSELQSHGHLLKMATPHEKLGEGCFIKSRQAILFGGSSRSDVDDQSAQSSGLSCGEFTGKLRARGIS